MNRQARKEYKRRMDWVRSLQVGDEVCDCRYKHLKIKELKAEHFPWQPWLVRQVIFADWMPMRVCDALDAGWEKLARALGMWEFHDYLVTLEDGNSCSAFNCCHSTADHEEDEHYELEETGD